MIIDQKIIFINDFPVKIIRKAIKNLHLVVYPPDGHVRVSAPKFFNDEAIKLAVISRWRWIKKHQESFKNQQRQSQRQYVSGESHYYLGQRYLLDVVSSSSPTSVQIKNKKIMTLNVKKNSCTEKKSKVLETWYRSEFQKLLPEIIKKWESKSELSVKAFSIRKMERRWGSCQSKEKKILLNLKLIKKPIKCIEYVVVHEMVHFLERRHNSHFISHMDRIMPYWRSLKDDLNNTALISKK